MTKAKHPEWGVLRAKRFPGWPAPMVQFWIGDRNEVIGLDAASALAFAEALHAKARKVYATKLTRKK